MIYQYDKIGNMTYNCKYGNYYYDDPLHKHAVTRVVKNGVTTNYAYDDNGNMTSGDGRVLTYDYDNRPISIVYSGSAVISVYDAGGQRVKKITPSSTTIYIGNLYECANGECTKYIFAGSQRIAQIDNTGTFYYHSDHLGSSNILTNSSGNKAQELFYYPYGEIKINSYNNITRYKFTGQEWDAEDGLYYYGARYYDPKLARFISADTIVPDFADPQTLNRFSYAGNNPVVLVDPNGHFFWVAVAIGAAVGAVSAGTQSDWNLDAMLKGAAIGAVSGAVGYGVGTWAGGLVPAGHVTVAAVVGGSAGGMAAGATSAAITGGNIGQGALIGMIAGGIGGYVGTYDFGNPYLEGAAQIGTGALVGGAASELTGGKFWEGFASGVISGAVAFATNRILEAKRYADPIEKQREKLFNELKIKADDIEWMENNPTKDLPRSLGDESVFARIRKNIYQSFGSEIDYIRTAGSGCGGGNCLRFGNFHIKSFGNQTYIHYDRANATYSPTMHYLRDSKNLFNW